MYETQLHVVLSYREHGRELLAPSVVGTTREAVAWFAKQRREGLLPAGVGGGLANVTV